MPSSSPARIRKTPYGGRPKYVKLSPRDDGEFLADVFFEDPRTFSPKPGPLGQVHAWGLYPYFYEDPEIASEEMDEETVNLPACDGMQVMMRQMKGQMMYYGNRPEDQFMKVILERKRQQLKDMNLKQLDKCDVIVKITMTGMRTKNKESRVWRQFKVSSGITLSAFQDKVVAPIMGWVRNFHCYTFTDFRDGALFGPESSASVDRMYIAQVGYVYLPDNKYKLAHLFGKEGDQIGYLYDFGDKWYHLIEILKIYPPEESTGKIEIIDGKGMCPGENMKGNLQYADFLDKYDEDSSSARAAKKREVLETPNYKHFGKPPSSFDPAVFDIQAARERLSEALSSSASVRSGAKAFNMPMVPGAESIQDGFTSAYLKKGQTITKQPIDEGSGYWREITSAMKDSRKEAVCASCGKPAAPDVQLKTCSACRMVLYCSTEHQKVHWKASHKKQCARTYGPQAK